ncbi:MAG TPA: dienelactone hydrolase family protein [Planctomycetota bacterium]
MLLSAALVFAPFPWAGLLAPAQDPAPVPVPALTSAERLETSPRHHEWVDVPVSLARKVRAFVVYPESAVARSVVLIIHENRGLNDWARAFADQVAEAGYIAVAPDLLSGLGPEGGGTAALASSDAARTALYELKPEQVLADLDAAIAYAKKIESANGQVVAAGFCWGGSQSFRLACHSKEIAAAMVFYGSAPSEAAELRGITAPVYGFYGENDARISAKIPDLAVQLKELGRSFEAVVYPGAGHAFMRSGETPEGGSANVAARGQAWQRMLSLLEKHSPNPEGSKGLPKQ